ncbi:hypothetical protein KGF56_002842 [Candida oxycetoniae]|uniref:GTPase-activating protein GYP5 n=1 Tax=Candida oxycetoniae TaxID=497107 RepID=A0AAI9SWM2_9ASCO|nr:uncharacterized protein KGF56_002842 [Candida oxycetoniae]KAI3404322.2 hypothetical protein KGF56_002842 [Candida oxycetoniae]
MENGNEDAAEINLNTLDDVKEGPELNSTQAEVETETEKNPEIETDIDPHSVTPPPLQSPSEIVHNVQLPSREPIQMCLQLDATMPQSLKEDNLENLEKLSAVSGSYDKTTSNYLLQSKHNILSLQFRDKDSNTQKTIEDGTKNIKSTFSNIKSIVGGINGEHSPYKIDWEFWTSVVEDYDFIVNNRLQQLNELITQGIPSEIRGIIWQIVTKSKDANLEDLYRLMKQEPSIHEKAIKRDLTRTSFFTNIDAVNKADELFNVIKAYSLYDPDVGYTQGMIFIAVPLIMNMNESECFCLLVLLMKEYKLRELFCPEMKGLHLLIYQFDSLLALHTPALYNHLVRQGIKSSMYASQWFLTFFAYKFPLDIVLRIYDVVITQGMESILKFAINLMVQNEDSLLALSFDKLLEFLKEKLFNVYVNPNFIKSKDEGRSSSAKRFSSILSRRSSGIIPSASSPTASTSMSSSIPAGSTSYYMLDQLVQDSMQINIDPLDLAKFENRFNKCYDDEKAKLQDINNMKIKNGKLRHQLKHLEFQYSNLDRDHVDVMQKMVNLKVTLPEVINDNNDLKSSIAKLQENIKELESKTESQDAHEVPSAIEDKIKELLSVNAQEVELTANLEDELDALTEENNQLDQQLKKTNTAWFKWG